VSGTSAKDALLTAAGVQPGEVATLQRELQRASEESRQWREKAAREHGQLEQSKIAAAKWDNERAVLRGDLRKATESLKGAQDQILTFEARIAELTTALESRTKQLACSLSLSGLGDCAAAIKALRDRLAKGDIQFSGDTAGDVEAVIANLDRPEMRTLSKMLTRRVWRIHAIRWLLRVRAAS
jgi:septal ring factor EnvC (AmiA/AmiB activator)